MKQMFEKREKGGAEFGLFAKDEIEAGAIIFPRWHEDFEEGDGWYCLSVEEILALPEERQKVFRRYGLDIGFSRIMGPGEDLDLRALDSFLNHSCEPNLTYDSEGNVVTARMIDRDEELTIDYGCFAVNFDEEFDCNCGAAWCRGRVRKDDWRELVGRYGFRMAPFLREAVERLMGDQSLLR